MSFFGRALLTAAVVAGVVHVFRRDIKRILGALQKPTETFISEVKKELESTKSSGSDDGREKEKAGQLASLSVKTQDSSVRKEEGTGLKEVDVEKKGGPLQ